MENLKYARAPYVDLLSRVQQLGAVKASQFLRGNPKDFLCEFNVYSHLVLYLADIVCSNF